MTYQNNTSGSTAVQGAPPQAETPEPLGFPYFRQSMRDDSDPMVCTVEHPQRLGADDPRLDPKLAVNLRGFIADQLQNEKLVASGHTVEYAHHRSHDAPADVPSVYETPEGRIARHWIEEGAEQIRTISPEWADDLAESLLATTDSDLEKKDIQFSFKETMGIDVDSVGGAIAIHSDRRLGYVQLGHDDIDRMIAELQEVKRESLTIRGDPVPA